MNSSPTRETSPLGKLLLHFALILIVGLAAYSNSFDAPFQMDEGFFIRDNPIVQDLGYFLHPTETSGAEGASGRTSLRYTSFKMRYVGYLTLAVNYALHGTETRGYHLFNYAVHLGNALLIYAFVILTFRTPFLRGSLAGGNTATLALLASLVFVAHPMQIEAVTYIYQRFASLVALFYLSCVVAYARFRLSEKRSRKYVYLTVSLVSAVLAMKTKENAFTLPLVLALYEFLFFTGAARKRLYRLLPFGLTMLIIPLSLFSEQLFGGGSGAGMDRVLRLNTDLSRGVYLLTQFRVIVTYLRLLLLPVNQNLDYDYPLFSSLHQPQVLASLLLLVLVAGLGISLVLLSRKRPPVLRFVAFGIFWFFTTISVESSIVPVSMVINEYRTYLPSVGAIPAALAALLLALGLVRKGKLRAVSLTALVLLPIALSVLAHNRNGVWQSRTGMWSDVIEKSPRKARGHNNLGLAYFSAGDADSAIKNYALAIRLKPRYLEPYFNLGEAYAAKGEYEKSIRYYQAFLMFSPAYYREVAHFNMAAVYEEQGITGLAIGHYEKAVSIKPDYREAHEKLASLYEKSGILEKAKEHSDKANSLLPR